jgi:hypothetical protein
MLEAVICVPTRADELDMYAESGVMKFLERWLRMGVSRSSSSRRGRARAVSCRRISIHSKTNGSSRRAAS